MWENHGRMGNERSCSPRYSKAKGKNRKRENYDRVPPPKRGRNGLPLHEGSNSKYATIMSKKSKKTLQTLGKGGKKDLLAMWKVDLGGEKKESLIRVENLLGGNCTT